MGGFATSVRLLRRGVAALAGAALVGGLISVPAGAVPVGSGVVGGFEVDGDLTGDVDWASVSALRVDDDALDSGYQGSSKELDPAGWSCNTNGNVPGKGDLLRAYVNSRVSDGNSYLDLAWVRGGTGQGDVHVSFELNRRGPATGPITSGRCGIDRQAGDVLVSFSFSGGNDPILSALYEWVPSGATGSWVDMNLSEAAVKAAVNTVAVEDPIGGGTIGDYRFGETSIDLRAAMASISGCRSFGFSNIRSRASQSLDSALQDRLPTTALDAPLTVCGTGAYQYRLSLDPANATNLVETDHVFTAGLERSIDGGNSFEAAGSETITFAFAGEGDVTAIENGSVDGMTCVTGTTGQCTVTIRSAEPGDSTLTATFAGISPSISLDGHKTWVNYRVTVTPVTSTGAVGTTHEFLVGLERDSGGGFEVAPGEDLDLDLTGVGTIGAEGCTTDADGECVVPATSALAGTSTLTATYHAVVSGVGRDFSDSGARTWVAVNPDPDSDPTTDPDPDPDVTTDPDPDSTTDPDADVTPGQQTTTPEPTDVIGTTTGKDTTEDPIGVTPADGPTSTLPGTPGVALTGVVTGRPEGDLLGSVTGGPVPAGELPRTGAGGLGQQALFALALLAAGLATTAAGRRTRPMAG